VFSVLRVQLDFPIQCYVCMYSYMSSDQRLLFVARTDPFFSSNNIATHGEIRKRYSRTIVNTSYRMNHSRYSLLKSVISTATTSNVTLPRNCCNVLLINCLYLSINLHTALHLLSILTNFLFALFDHVAVATLSPNENTITNTTTLSFGAICTVRLKLNFRGLAINFDLFCLIALMLLFDDHTLVVFIFIFAIYNVEHFKVKFIYTACNRLCLSTDIKVLLTYLLTYLVAHADLLNPVNCSRRCGRDNDLSDLYLIC